ncbi:MAG: hypothetical protein HY074_03780 [Deltaproteobacteria bacterium]|nr:hypothetical protein [Deltaproteobacteria bacterium]
MKQESRFLIAKLFAIVAAALVFGCAPPSPNGMAPDRMAALKAASLTGGAAAVSDGNWSCPSSANVLLKDNIITTGWDFTGLDDFTICKSTSNNLSFKVNGTTESGALCFYPMNQPATGAPHLAANPQCYSVTGSAILPVFTNATATINYMVVVDANYTEAMNKCLGSSSPCPAHSEGFIQ